MSNTASLLEIMTLTVHALGILLIWHLIQLTLEQKKSVILRRDTLTVSMFDARILAANRNLWCECNRVFVHILLMAIVIGMLFRPDITTLWATFIHIVLTSIAVMSIITSILDVLSERKLSELMASV